MAAIDVCLFQVPKGISYSTPSVYCRLCLLLDNSSVHLIALEILMTGRARSRPREKHAHMTLKVLARFRLRKYKKPAHAPSELQET